MSAAIRRSLSLVQRMALALEQLGQPADADRLAHEYLAEHPSDRDAAELVGALAIKHGDWPRARTIYAWLVSTNPGAEDLQARLMLAMAQARTGEVKDALANATAAYRMQRMNGRATWLLGKLLQQAGGHDRQAQALLAKATAMGVS